MDFPRFRPQRWYPRYLPVAEFGSRVPGGLAIVSSLLWPVARDNTPSQTEVPNDHDHDGVRFAVVAFPRTGSTFLMSTVAAAGQDPESVRHTHNVFAIKRFLDDGIHVLVPVRNPLDTALSWSIYNGDDARCLLLRSRFDAYTAWYRQALRYADHPQLHFVDFDTFTVEPHAVVEELSLDVAHRITRQHVQRALHELHAEQLLDKRQTHMPSDERGSLVDRYTDLLDEPTIQRVQARAQRVYAKLQTRLTGVPDSQSGMSLATDLTLASATGAGLLGAATALSRIIN